MKNIALFIAAVLTAIARAEEHDNAETSIAKSLVKIVYQQGSQYNYACTGVSVGEGLFLTASACIGRNNWIYGKSKKRYKAEVLKKGVSYGIGANKIYDEDANWAILRAPKLRLSPVSIAAEGMKYGRDYCVSYLLSKRHLLNNYNSQNIEPVRVCGEAGKRENLHRDILWGGAFKNQIGFWGAPVLNSENKIVGILSYSTGNFQKSGVLELESFSEAIKAIAK